MNADIFVTDMDESDSNMFDFMPEELHEFSSPQLRQSHLRLIIKHFPGLAKMALDRCMSNNLIRELPYMTFAVGGWGERGCLEDEVR